MLFGRKDLSDAYRQAIDLAIRHKVFRICQVEEIEGAVQVTVCNLWRVRRYADGDIVLHQFNTCLEQWAETHEVRHWPYVPLWPVHNTSPEWWTYLVKAALRTILADNGFLLLPKELAYTNPAFKPGAPARGMTTNKMVTILFSRYLGTSGGGIDMATGRPLGRAGGILEPGSMQAGCRALRAALWQHCIDREVFSAVLAINYKSMALSDYLIYARHRTGLLKVASEHRNLLPLLTKLNPAQWARPDLFSRQVWVKGARKSTALDRRPLRPSTCDSPLSSFTHAAAWRWLSRAPSSVVNAWANGKKWNHHGHTANSDLIVNLALANISVRVPATVYVWLIRGYTPEMCQRGVCPQMQALLRIFVLHAAARWKEHGFARLRHWLRHEPDAQLSHVFDYLLDEGFGCGLPDKQTTWTSLLRASRDWHQRIAHRRLETALRKEGRLREWTSALPATTVDGIVFLPLCNSSEMAIEGYELSHCVGTHYVEWSFDGKYQAFSVREPNGTRSTLGLRIHGNQVEWDQHQGPHNSAVSAEALRAGTLLAQRYQTALQGQRVAYSTVAEGTIMPVWELGRPEVAPAQPGA